MKTLFEIDIYKRAYKKVIHIIINNIKIYFIGKSNFSIIQLMISFKQLFRGFVVNK